MNNQQIETSQVRLALGDMIDAINNSIKLLSKTFKPETVNTDINKLQTAFKNLKNYQNSEYMIYESELTLFTSGSSSLLTVLEKASAKAVRGVNLDPHFEFEQSLDDWDEEISVEFALRKERDQDLEHAEPPKKRRIVDAVPFGQCIEFNTQSKNYAGKSLTHSKLVKTSASVSNPIDTYIALGTLDKETKMFARHVGTNIQHVMYVSAQVNRFEPDIQCEYIGEVPANFKDYVKENPLSLYKLWHQVIEPELILEGEQTKSEYTGCMFFPTFPSLSPIQSIACCMDLTQATSLLPSSSSYPHCAMTQLALLAYGLAKVNDFEIPGFGYVALRVPKKSENGDLKFSSVPVKGNHKKLPESFTMDSFMIYIERPFANSQLSVFVRVKHFETLSKYMESVYIYFMSESLIKSISEKFMGFENIFSTKTQLLSSAGSFTYQKSGPEEKIEEAAKHLLSKWDDLIELFNEFHNDTSALWASRISEAEVESTRVRVIKNMARAFVYKDEDLMKPFKLVSVESVTDADMYLLSDPNTRDEMFIDKMFSQFKRAGFNQLTGIFTIFESGVVPLQINCKMGKVSDYENEPIDCLRQRASFVHAMDLLYKSKTPVFTNTRVEIKTAEFEPNKVYGDLISALHSGFLPEGKNKYFKSGENQNQKKLDLKSCHPFTVEFGRCGLYDLPASLTQFRYESAASNDILEKVVNMKVSALGTNAALTFEDLCVVFNTTEFSACEKYLTTNDIDLAVNKNYGLISGFKSRIYCLGTFDFVFNNRFAFWGKPAIDQAVVDKLQANPLAELPTPIPLMHSWYDFSTANDGVKYHYHKVDFHTAEEKSGENEEAEEE